MLDQELRALVSVDPGPEFAARVRATIARQPSRRSWQQSWQLALAAAAVVVLIITSYWVDRSLLVAPPDAAGELVAADRLLPSSALRFGSPVLRPAVQPRPATSLVVDTRAIGRPVVQIDRAESEALQRLFAAPPRVAIDVTPEPSHAIGLMEIPELAIVPLTSADISKGDSQ